MGNKHDVSPCVKSPLDNTAIASAGNLTKFVRTLSESFATGKWK